MNLHCNLYIYNIHIWYFFLSLSLCLALRRRRTHSLSCVYTYTYYTYMCVCIIWLSHAHSMVRSIYFMLSSSISLLAVNSNPLCSKYISHTHTNTWTDTQAINGTKWIFIYTKVIIYHRGTDLNQFSSVYDIIIKYSQRLLLCLCLLLLLGYQHLA